MAPSHGSHATQLWRDVHSFYLLSPLMGFLSKAWSRLRRPGSSEPWQVRVVAGADEVEAGLQVDASAAVASPQWGRHPQEEANGSEAPEDGEKAAWMPPVDLESSHSSPPETWGLSDGNDKENVQKEGSRVPGDEERKSMDGQPAPWSPGLLIRGLQGSDSKCGEEAAEEEGGTELSYPSSHWDDCPAVEDNNDGEAVEEAPGATSPVSPQAKPSTWVHCPGEEEDRTTEEEKRTEVRETSISPTSSYPKSWECCPGEAPEETGEAKPELAPAPRQLLRGWECPSNDSEEEEEEEEDTALGAASILLLGASVGTWVCLPGEDTEDEDSELESAEEGGDTEASSLTPPTSAFLKAWVYRPGEDTEEEEEEDNEDSELESAAEEGEAEASSSKLPTNVFLKTWVYRPGEDTEEEEEEEEEDQFDDSEAAEGGEAAESSPRSTQIRSWACQPKETEEEKAPEPRPFQVAIYLPGERPPAPWAAPQLPIRLQKRLRLKETPTQEPNDEIPLNTRKVRFSEKVTVHFLVVWAGAAQAARRGPWEQFARDRSRFARRIAQAQEELGPCLTPSWRARAWARLGNPFPFLAPIPAPTQTLPSSLSSEVPAQATPLPSSPLL